MNDEENNKQKKQQQQQKKKKRKSVFKESDELAEKLAAAREKAAQDRANCLTANNAQNELTYMILSRAFEQMLLKKPTSNNSIIGSMEKISSKMWKGALNK